MTEPAPTDHILRQDRAPVRAIEALGTIQPTDPFERALARLLMAAYKRRLRAIVAAAPGTTEAVKVMGEPERPKAVAVTWISPIVSPAVSCVLAYPSASDRADG